MKNFLIWIIIPIILPYISDAKELKIVSTIKPIYDIVNAITKKDVNYLMIGKNNSVHHHSFKPGDYYAIENSDIVFMIDDDFEYYMKKLIQNKDKKDSEIIKLSHINGLNILKYRSNHHDGVYDYHIWLDISNSIKIANYVMSILIKHNPSNEEYYKHNNNSFVKKLLEIDSKFTKNLRDFSYKKYLVSHDAYQYFEKRYNLSVPYIINENHDGEISLKKFNDLRNLIKNEDIKCIFIEPKYNIEMAKNLGSNKLKIVSLNAESNNGKSDENSFLDMLEDLEKNIRFCLED